MYRTRRASARIPSTVCNHEVHDIAGQYLCASICRSNATIHHRSNVIHSCCKITLQVIVKIVLGSRRRLGHTICSHCTYLCAGGEAPFDAWPYLGVRFATLIPDGLLKGASLPLLLIPACMQPYRHCACHRTRSRSAQAQVTCMCGLWSHSWSQNLWTWGMHLSSAASCSTYFLAEAAKKWVRRPALSKQSRSLWACMS